MATKVYTVDRWGNKEGKGTVLIESNKVYRLDQWGNKTDKGRLIIDGSYNLTELVAILERSAIF